MAVNFSAEVLSRRLGAMKDSARVVFAFAAAVRQTICLERYFTKSHLALNAEALLREIWSEIKIGDVSSLETRIAQLMALMPEDEDSPLNKDIMGEHCLASTAYAVQAKLNDDLQEYVWAAQRAYDAADQAAIRIIRDVEHRPIDEEIILNHAIVQRELTRQLDCLNALSGVFDADDLINQAFTLRLLTDAEWGQLDQMDGIMRN